MCFGKRFVKHRHRRGRELELFGQGKDELNFAEFPLATVSNRVLDGSKTVVFEGTGWDRRLGRRVARRLTISGSERYGLPTATDDGTTDFVGTPAAIRQTMPRDAVSGTVLAVLRTLGKAATAAQRSPRAPSPQSIQPGADVNLRNRAQRVIFQGM